MDYLKSSLEFLEQENKELKDKIRMMENLQNIINQQRSEEQK
jgi:hypothetical protein